MSKLISQYEARRLRKDLNALKQTRRNERHGYLVEWPEGVHILTLGKNEANGAEDSIVIRTARILGHPVMVTERNGELYFYAVTP